MNVSVTPPNPTVQPKPAPYEFTYEENGGKGGKQKLIFAAIGVVVVIAIIVGLYFAIGTKPVTTVSTTTMGTTTQLIVTNYLSQCGKVDVPGRYFVQGSIKYMNASGVCLNITASDVAIVCGNQSIKGSGPYVGVPPFSYGIMVSGGSNVSIDDCAISNFSYGIYANGASGLGLHSNRLHTNYMSDLFMSGVTGGTVEDNYLSNSSSEQGALVVANLSSNNTFMNNTLRFNTFYGFNVVSSGNRFVNNVANASAFDFACGPQYGFSQSSSASGNLCFNNSGCGFLTCRSTNIPDNVSKIPLGTLVNSCGNIRAPGTYSLAQSLNMKSYSSANLSQLALYNMPCLSISGSNINLQCHDFNISNAYEGIVVTGSNVTLDNCGVVNSDIGISLDKANKASLYNTKLTDNNASLSLQGISGASINHINASQSVYGVVFKNSSADIMQNFTTNYNIYGLYISNSLGNIFNGGVSINNSRIDVYAAADSANTSSDIMTRTACGTTNTQWAPCTVFVSNTAANLYPLSACTQIKRPGNYYFTNNITLAGTDCIGIQSNNVALNCKGHSITSFADFTPGPGIIASNRKNVTIDNCAIVGYSSSAAIMNSTGVNITNTSLESASAVGLNISNDTDVMLSHLHVYGPSNYSVGLIGSRNVTLLASNLSQGTNRDVALLVQNTTQSLIANNIGYQNGVGIYFKGRSTNNTVSNNNFGGDQSYDYQCDAIDSPLNAESGGINTGTAKSGCHWLAAIPIGANPLGCSSVSVGYDKIFTQDYVYSAGAVCYNFMGNDTTFNCNGHTILATNGGLLAEFTNKASGGKLQDCYLKGFSDPIAIKGASATIFNNTIYENHSYGGNDSIINVSGSPGFVVEDNHILAYDRGITVSHSTSGKILGNNVTTLSTSYTLSDTNYTNVDNNTASIGDGVGALVENSQQNSFQLNNLAGVTAGLLCTGTSVGSPNNTDAGNNYCSSNLDCKWISFSSTTCH